MKIGIPILLTVVVLLAIAMVFTSGWERPPLATEQTGYRGTGMAQINNPRTVEAVRAMNTVPELVPAVPSEGTSAASTYKNVQVLGDLDTGEFDRLMTAITNWVSPQQGCAYCHKPGDLASDDLYTHKVARNMLVMTRHVNADWKQHVGDTGVTCYTCHRGQPVPADIWFTDTSHGKAYSGRKAGQNAPAATVGSTSLPGDPFTAFLSQPSESSNGANEILVQSTSALPAGNPHDIMETEWTYGLMMHVSQSLGVNCTFCHNSRSFFAWDGSTPKRTTAWNGIRMVRDLNGNFLTPLTEVFRRERLGPSGDAPKLNCATCHQGVNKPLHGASMLKDYPALGTAPPGDLPTAEHSTAEPAKRDSLERG